MTMLDLSQMPTPPAPESRIPDTPSNAPKGPVKWVLNKRDLEDLLEALQYSVCNVMDLETTGLDEYSTTGGTSNGGVGARIVMASLTLPQAVLSNGGMQWDGFHPVTYIVPLSHPDSPFLGTWRKVMRIIAERMVRHNIPFVNHHTKFDARWIYATIGVDLSDLIEWDTQSSSHLLDETRSTKLKDRAPETFGIERWDDHDLTYPGAAEEVEFWELGEYAARDTWWTWELYRDHVRRLFLDQPEDEEDVEIPQTPEEFVDARLGRVAKYITAPTAKSLAKIEQRGIRLDLEYVHENLAAMKQLSSDRLDQISDMYDLPRKTASTASASHWFKELVDKAVTRDELRVMSMTAKGNPQWDKHVLGKQARQGSEIARLVLEQRDAAKQAEFYTSWLAKVSPHGFIHSTYRSGHVSTGRLSSADPNMQQVSRKMKRAFIPRDGYVFAEADYSQLELRVAAFISRCQPMLDALNEGKDLHSLFAADMATRRRRRLDPNAPEVGLEEVTPDERQKAKSGNFGLLYLQRAEGFRTYAENNYGVDMTQPEADEIYDGFFTTWDGMAEWHQRTIETSRRHGYTVSPLGRIRNLPDINTSNDYLRGSAERQSVNSPVQGMGSDLMQLAIASMFGILPGSTPIEGAHPVATVHDSVELELEEDRWEEQAALVQDRMQNLDPWLRSMGVTFDVPLVSDLTVGRWWGDDSISHPPS